MTERHGPQSEQQLFDSAAEWLFRLREPGVSAEEISRWLAWCAASVDNQRAFERMQSLWRQAGAVEERPIAREDLDGDEYAGQVPVQQWRQRRIERAGSSARYWRKFVAAIVARPALTTMLAAAMLVILVGPVWWVVRAPAPAVETFVADIGINREIDLSDGSQIVVGGGSALQARFDATRRQVHLDQGEAYFKVHKDPGRPFVVHAMGTTITAVGTAFNVKVDAGIVRVTVTEGTVDVRREPTLLSTLRAKLGTADAPDAVRLTSGNQAMRQSATAPVVVRPTVSDATTWMEGTLTFVGEPLAEVVASVNRYSSTRLVVSDAELGSLLFTGTVVPDRVDEWLQALPKIFPVQVRERADQIEIAPRLAAEH
jgi:transmembrane sensor